VGSSGGDSGVNVAVTGSSGLIGTALIGALSSAGHSVTRVVRREAGEGEIRWDPDRGVIDRAGLEGHDAVVHLAGVGVADSRWTEEHKAAVLGSREKGTTLLAESLASLADPPAVFASASAVGFYGDRGDEVVDESSPGGSGFLPEVVRRWEAATAAAEAAGIRVAHVRSGIVLSGRGGALQRQLLPFRLGLGGRIGSGRQFLSWISIDDEVAAIGHVLTDASMAGPVNLTAPAPVTNAEFTKTLGTVLRRPTLLPVPTLALRLMFGGQAVEEMFLAGQRVIPRRLQEAGYQFQHGRLEAALRHVLARTR
jgi:uncharacterized protein (TIGR01777 family)